LVIVIGILCNEDEKEIVQEFFELFKTPWEFSAPDVKYDVVVSTLPEIDEIDAGLIVLYSSQPTEFDKRMGIELHQTLPSHLVDLNGTSLPIYGKIAVLHRAGSNHQGTDSGTGATVVEIHDPLKVIRVGYDLFREVDFLLSESQPVENAQIPALDIHISLLRNWIVKAGISFVEIPPVPFEYKFFACLTHDIDFVGIRRHKFDHTMWGFIYRGLFGSLIAFLGGKISLAKLVTNWMTVLKLPLVFTGVVGDFWANFDRYAAIEDGLSSTFFLIPFKNRTGEKISNKYLYKRAAHYDIGDVEDQVRQLVNLGFEIGSHGIDAWHSAEKGSEEMKRIHEVSDRRVAGIRMHWLCYDRQSPSVLELAGFEYDATLGYNETIGFRNGTLQVFKPVGACRLLEIPLNIQDTALFSPHRLNLSDMDASQLCNKLIESACQHGGVLTLLWHCRSLEAERLWGDFYQWLLGELRNRGAWIGNAHQIVEWFRRRRSIAFTEFISADNNFEVGLIGDEPVSDPRVLLRFHLPSRSTKSSTTEYDDYIIDLPWNGEASLEISTHERESA